MRVLITDAFCSANRGDAAILDGILTGLRARIPDVTLEVTSHFPALTQRFHDSPTTPVHAIDDRDVVAVMRAIDRADLVVGCGGSYLHDLYALNLHPRLATIHACARAGKPYVAFAQSIGPFDSPLSRTGARNALSDAAWIVVRDEASARVVRELGVTTPVMVGVDAAIASRTTPQPRGTDRPLLGVTVRGWSFPGHDDPTGAQLRYERAVAAACAGWAQRTGGVVRFLSNCTAFGGYNQDDRLAARRVAENVGKPAEVVEQDDLPFDVVRGQAAACDLLLGTRMHSLIFATTAGVPAVGIAYEFKTREWMDQIGCPELWRPIEDCVGLTAMVHRAWDERAALRATITPKVAALKARAEAQLDQLVAVARGAHPTPARADRVATRGDWNGETWKYDRPHRRLRVVADLVVGEATGGRVLDLGSSTGLLGRMIGPRFDYTGLDVAPSVARAEPGFRIRTAGLDGDWPLDRDPTGAVAPFDVVLASGALEYVADLPATLRRIRSVLRPAGLAVVTLFNLAHVSRGPGATRHPTWRFDARPDEFVLYLREAGLPPVRLVASSAGRGAAPAVDAEVPTDLDRSGAVQTPVPALFQLAHHLVAVCRAGAPKPGPARVEELFVAGEVVQALRLAVATVKDAPWSARAWSDLGVVWLAAGDVNQAHAALTRAKDLDPSRPGLDDDLAAVASRLDPARAATGG